jgi:FecR protein
MNDDYLWDGSGEPDPEIQKLETTLGRFRHNRPAPEFPQIAAAPLRPSGLPIWTSRPFVRWSVLAFAAATILIAAVLRFTPRHNEPGPRVGAGWEMASLAGTPHVGGKVISKNGGAGKFVDGETIETDSASRAKITDEATGEVEIEPNTLLRSIETSASKKHLSLDRGTIKASIWAPPGEFVVNTPGAVTVDLGCAYTLHVDDSGAGLLRTTLGWVGFKLNGRESFIPAGAACATRPHVGPGTPYYEDASEKFRDALSRFDFGSETFDQQSVELTAILAESRKRDALTLWHLLSRVSEQDRGRVYDRLAGFVPPPADVTREGVLHLDQRQLDSWWSSLGLGDISLWRTWERSWSQREGGAKP